MNTTVSERSGFTLIELIVSMVLFGLVTVAALAFVQSQNRGLRIGTEHAKTVQNLRYAILRLEGDLRTLGTNVPAGQPSLVYAGEDIIAFFADFATNVEGDPFAVHYTPGAPQGQVSAPSAPVPLPTTAVSVPDTLYEASPNIPSPAELLVYFFLSDTASANPDDFALYRKINQAEPELIAQNLQRVEGRAFFSYLRLRGVIGGGVALDSIPENQLPLRHTARRHGSPADTAGSARVDSIRGIRVSVSSVGPDVYGHISEIEASRVIRFPNIGLSEIRTCGSQPILNEVPVAAFQDIGGLLQVTIRWDPAVDEAGGEEDVVRYVLWRRTGAGGSWGDPLRSIPAGQPGYETVDTEVSSGDVLQYALAAQDCTPSLSDLTVSNLVVLP